MRVIIDIKVTVRAQCWRCNKTEEGVVELSTAPLRYSSVPQGRLLEEMEENARGKHLKGWSSITVSAEDETDPYADKDLCQVCTSSFRDWKSGD